MTPHAVPFDSLSDADLVVDGVYRGGRGGNAGDDPFPRLLSVSNMGGFRYRGSLASVELLVLTSTLADPDWPDAIDRETGVFTYYGDNKHPGRGLHDTPRFGNCLLRDAFQNAADGAAGRLKVPPILVFCNTGEWRDVAFLGLAVPGTSDERASEDLVAIWRVAKGKRFQNYRARFTVLDVPTVPRSWLLDVISGTPLTERCPGPWRAWVEKGVTKPLLAARSIEHRLRNEQLPADAVGVDMVEAIREYFAERPVAFERCAASIAGMMLPGIASLDLTRPSRDGGRDAVGQMRIGKGPAGILVEFALEAKCYGASNAVGVKETSRLISRLRHRQFGVLVTTSYVHAQAYQELKEDGHPVVVISASDIVDLLKANGIGSKAQTETWLKRDFPLP